MSTLIKKHMTLPFLNKGTSASPDWVQIKKATEFAHSLNPETEERDYISDEQATTELMQYKPSMSLSVTTLEGEADFDLFFDLYKTKAVGEDAKKELLIVYLFKTSSASGVDYYYAYKANATISVSEFNSVDSTISVEINENGTPVNGFVYLDDGVPVFTAGELPTDEGIARTEENTVTVVQVQEAYGTYSLPASTIEEVQGEYFADLSEAGLSYDAAVNSLSLELEAGQALSLKATIGYGYENAHYPRDYECVIPGKYTFVAGNDEGRISALSFDYSAMTATGTYTGDHNETGAHEEGDETKRSAGELVEDETGTGVSEKLLAVLRQVAASLATKWLEAGLTYSNGVLKTGGVEIASK